MSNILCAKVTGLSDGTNIYVIVLETAVLMVGDIVCFPLSMYYCNFLQLYLQYSFHFREKFCEILS